MDTLPEWLTKLSPQSVIAVVVLWMLREFFGFVRMLIKDLKGSSRTDGEVEIQIDMKLISKALEDVSRHIQESTKLTQTFVSSMEAMNKDITELRREVRELQQGVDSAASSPH